MLHFTPEMRESASRANPVDEALHEFVSAKFCQRLRKMDVLDHPVVANELASTELIVQRCMGSATKWAYCRRLNNTFFIHFVAPASK